MRWSVPLRKLGITFSIGLLLLAVLTFAALLAGCVTTPSRPPVQPGPDRTAEYEATCKALYLSTLERPVDAAGLASCVGLAREGKTAEQIEAILKASAEYISLHSQPPVPPPPVVEPPNGQVRASVHSLRDDSGPRLYWGTSLFWALWGELHDTARLDANLKTASESGADYIRVFAQVGGESWKDRAVDPRDPGWQAAVRSLTDKAYDRYGLRVQWTLFAWAKNLTQAQREAAVSAFLSAIEGRHEKVWAVEIANEGDENGPIPADARSLAGRLRVRFPGLIAVTAPTGDSCLKQAPWYRDSVATLITLHFARNISGEGKLWRPVRQPWRESTFRCDGQAGAYSSNEPIGPKSSVNEDDDPLRLVMAAVVGWTGGVGAYVYHTDAGIRGGGFADRARGRRSNLSEVTKFEQTTAGLNTARSLLPADLPNWTRGTSNPRMFDVSTFDGPSNPGRGTIDRVYCAWRGSEFVCAAFNIYKNTTLTAKRALSVKVLNPLTGAVQQDVTLATGGTLQLAGVTGGTAVILRGVFR